MISNDPEFLASWQRVEKCLSYLDESQVERLFSEKHASLSDFHQALSHEMDIKMAEMDAQIASLNRENASIRKETEKIKSETEKLCEKIKHIMAQSNNMKRLIKALKND